MSVPSQLTWNQLVAVARRVGVKVIEAPSSHRGKLGNMGSVVGVVCHHTGTANTYSPATDYPDFNVVKEGRAGLVNSLSAYGVGRRDAIYVFSEYLSWHAGVWNWQGITDGNGHFLGIECAGVGDYTDFQRQVYPRLVAAILLEIRAPRSMAPRHLDGAMPRGRKSDAANFDGNFYQGKSFYQWVDYFLANPSYINVNYQGDADMPLNDADKAWIKDALRSEIADRVIAADENGNNLQWWQVENLLKDRQVGYGTRIEQMEARQIGYGTRVENIEAMVAKLLDSLPKTS
jgi:hypothetical protein